MKTPLRNKTTFHLLSIGFLLFAISSPRATAAVLYEEDFTRSNVGGNNAVNTLGWNAYFSSAATDISSSNTQVAISPAVGNPNTSFGALFAAPTAANQAFAAVETFSSGITIPTDGAGDITWTMGNGNTTSSVRLLIQIGGSGTTGSGTWYASSTAFSNTTSFANFSAFSSASTASVTQSLDFTLQASDWRSFTLTPGSSMALGSVLSSDLSSNTITGIGFYMQTTTSGQNIRLDTLTVVPEPSSAALALVAGATLVTAVSRRRR